MTETPSTIPTNRNAVISLIAAILTILSFCGAVVPIPLTGFVCYPAAAVLGLAALATGINSLRQIRSSGENGRPFAVIGTIIGTLTAIAVMCVFALAIAFLPQVIAFLRQIPTQPSVSFPPL